MTSSGSGIETWDLDRLIHQDDIAFEEEISRDPFNHENWLSYYHHKASTDGTTFYNKVFILERAVQNLPKSDQLWIMYLELVQGAIEKLTYFHHKHQFLYVNKLFDRSLALLYTNTDIWVKYLHFLTKTQPNEVTLIRRKFNLALRSLPIRFHGLIWPLFLSFADSVGGKTGSVIYEKYLQYIDQDIFKGLKTKPVTDQKNFGGSIEDFIEKFDKFGDFHQVSQLYKTIIENPEEYISLSRTILQIWLDYIEYMLDAEEATIQDAEEEGHQSQQQASTAWHSDDLYFEELVLKGIEKFPDQIGKFYMKLTQYYKLKIAHEDKVRYFYDKGIKECVTVQDFLLLYNAYISFEEELIDELSEKLESNPDDEKLDQELEYRLYYFNNLINNRPLLLNDMMLRQDINNLDVWFERFKLFHDDLNQKLQTFAQALIKINPFKAHSLLGNESHKLSKIWIDYTKIYSIKQDFKTANLIFTKAKSSQFHHPDELAEIYIAWSEMILESNYKDADTRSVTIIEEVLLSDTTDNKIDYDDSSIDIHRRIKKSMKLWLFYIDLLESFIESDTDESEINKVIEAYNRLIEIKMATPNIIIAFANFLESYNYIEKSFTIYEIGLKSFKDPSIKYEIWNVYLTKILKSKTENYNIERIRDLFEQALDQIPSYLGKQFLILYSDFEQKHGSVMNSIKILRRGLKLLSLSDNINNHQNEKAFNKNQLIEDKFSIYTILIIKTEQFQDEIELRKILQSSIQDLDLSITNLVELTTKFISFETKLHQYERVRKLFQYIIRLIKNSEGKLWAEWEQFEINNGNETTFKDMLRFKRTINQEFKDIQSFKNSVNPMGFVKSSEGPKVSSINASEPKEPESTNSNPDEIDLDMDM